LKQYKGYLIDLDGTIYRGNQVIDGAREFVGWLRKRNLPYLFVTNNSSVTKESVAAKLCTMGVKAKPNQVITSGYAAANYIKRRIKNPNVYMIGEEGLKEALNESDIPITNKGNANVVLIGLDRQITYKKLATAALAVQNGAAFISTNRDAAIPSEDGFVPGNGSLTAVISASTGTDPTFIGKPETIMMEEALKQLNLAREEVVLIGDNYATDMLAGSQAGIDTVMVFTGVTRREDLLKVNLQPTYCINTLHEWINKENE
jgi:4-nitrophenyl phosphatase